MRALPLVFKSHNTNNSCTSLSKYYFDTPNNSTLFIFEKILQVILRVSENTYLYKLHDARVTVFVRLCFVIDLCNIGRAGLFEQFYANRMYSSSHRPRRNI